MKSRYFACFSIGALVATIALGTVQYVTAASDSTIAACANKTTGAMRLLSKGSCKKTETRVAWNEQGPQGLPGAAGVAGAKGDAGATGAAGTPATNFHAIDATGKDLGVVVTATTALDEVYVLSNGGLWRWSVTNYFSGSTISQFRDSSCSTPIFQLDPPGYGIGQPAASPNARFVLTSKTNNQPVSAFKISGPPVQLSTILPIYRWDTYRLRCIEQVFDGPPDPTSIVYGLEQVDLPTYTAPLSIVSK